MKPNTLAMGFYTRDLPINTLETLHNRLLKRHKIIRSLLKDTSLEKYDSINSSLPPLRQSVSTCNHSTNNTDIESCSQTKSLSLCVCII